MATVKPVIQEVVEFPINTGMRVAADWGASDTWPGVRWKYVHRYAEELRAHYRVKFGRGNYRVKVERRRDEITGRHIARIIAFTL